MSNNVDAIVKYWVKKNNQNIKIAFPAVIVGVENLSDGLIDVQPLVDFMNPETSESVSYPTLYDIRVVFPSTKNSTICFPVNQGDFVDLIVQSVDIQKFVNGNEEQHSPSFLSYNNLANVVAFVGFSPFQHSCFNANNYKNEFDNQDLNIVHNKNTGNEVSINLKTDGDITIKSPTRVVVEAKEVELLSDKVNANSAVIDTQGDVMIGGRSVKQFMATHTHIGNQGSPTSPPQGV